MRNRSIMKSNNLQTLLIFILMLAFSAFIASIYFTSNVEYAETSVKLIALDSKNDLSLNSEVNIASIRVNNTDIQPSTLISGWNNNQFNELFWNADQVGLNKEASGVIPQGNNRFIIFNANRWKGMCELIINGESTTIDLYRDSDNGTFAYELKGDKVWNESIILKTVIKFLEVLITLIVTGGILKYLKEKCNKDYKLDLNIITFIEKNIYLLFLIAITILAIFIRIKLFSHISGDYSYFLLPWYKQLEQDGVYGLKNVIGNYTEGYMLFLALLTYIPIKPLYGIKLFSCAFDFFSAVIIAKIIYDCTKNKNKKLYACLGYGCTLILPTVVFNSAYWAQCDSIYVFFILLAIYFFLKDKSFAMFFSVGISFCFKLQAIFILPVLLIIYYKRKNIPVFCFGIIPLVYFLISIPALVVGKPIKEIINTVMSYGQGTTESLTSGLNNIYTFVLSTDTNVIKYIQRMGIITTVILLGLLMLYYAVKINKLTFSAMLGIFLTVILVIAYFLPGMHERYLYMGDLISILWFVVIADKKYWYIPMGVNAMSLFSYLRYVTDVWPGSEYNILTEVNMLCAFMYLFFMVYAIIQISKVSIIKSNENNG